MSDLISREQTIKALRAYAGRKHGAGHIELANGILNAICLIEEVAEVPSVEAVPVVHGEWIVKTDEQEFAKWDECSVCEHKLEAIGCGKDYNFCPNCGADMRKKV